MYSAQYRKLSNRHEAQCCVKVQCYKKVVTIISGLTWLSFTTVPRISALMRSNLLSLVTKVIFWCFSSTLLQQQWFNIASRGQIGAASQTFTFSLYFARIASLFRVWICCDLRTNYYVNMKLKYFCNFENRHMYTSLIPWRVRFFGKKCNNESAHVFLTPKFKCMLQY